MYRGEPKYEDNARVHVQVRGGEWEPGRVMAYLGNGLYQVALPDQCVRQVEERYLTPRARDKDAST
jgi:hypothetical protein